MTTEHPDRQAAHRWIDAMGGLYPHVPRYLLHLEKEIERLSEIIEQRDVDFAASQADLRIAQAEVERLKQENHELMWGGYSDDAFERLKKELASERTLREQADRERERLEDLLVEACCVGGPNQVCTCGLGDPCVEASAILARRESKSAAKGGSE